MLASRLVNLTRQAWNPSDECFEVVLKVCSDYENGFHFHSEGDETKWKELVEKNDLDTTVDTNRPWMTAQWFKPLIKVPDSLYLGVVKSYAARIVDEDGISPP